MIQAKTESVSIPVKYNNIKITVDGKSISTDNEPFIYNGVTYLPVRDVANATGKTVSWDNDTKTVNLISKKDNVSNTQNTNNKKTITLSNGNYVVGKDLPAGKYNIKCIKGSGSISTDDYEISIFLVSPELLEQYNKIFVDMFYSEYNNAILEEGKKLEVSDITIELTPVN